MNNESRLKDQILKNYIEKNKKALLDQPDIINEHRKKLLEARIAIHSNDITFQTTAYYDQSYSTVKLFINSSELSDSRIEAENELPNCKEVFLRPIITNLMLEQKNILLHFDEMLITSEEEEDHIIMTKAKMILETCKLNPLELKGFNNQQKMEYILTIPIYHMSEAKLYLDNLDMLLLEIDRIKPEQNVLQEPKTGTFISIIPGIDSSLHLSLN